MELKLTLVGGRRAKSIGGKLASLRATSKREEYELL
jgi:hypothetical protein